MAEPWLLGMGAVNAALALGLVPTMTLFVGRVAFAALPPDHARAFLRAAFPVYHAMLMAFTVAGAAALAWHRPVDAAILGGVAVTNGFAWFWLMPIAHRLDDLTQAGQNMTAELLNVQKRSSLIIVAQLGALVAVVVRLALTPYL